MEISDNKVNTGLVSIIIPTYNRSELLQEAIQSCMDQIYRPIECIIVDDGSTDNTKELVNKFIKNSDENFTVKYVYQQNAGAQVARNTGTDAVSGVFIQYLDSDDLLYPTKIQLQIDYMQKHPNCDAVFGDWHRGILDEKETVMAYKSNDLIVQFLTKKCIVNFSMLMRTSLAKKIGDWDIHIKRNQEIDFHLRGVLAGGNFEYLPGICGLWRTHQEERIITATGIKDVLFFFDKWENILSEKNMLSNDIKKNIAEILFWFAAQKTADASFLKIKILEKAVSLNSSIHFFNTTKMKILRNMFGKKNAIRIWANQAKL